MNKTGAIVQLVFCAAWLVFGLYTCWPTLDWVQVLFGVALTFVVKDLIQSIKALWPKKKK